jgi:CRP-like cAMP-binding protein
VDFAFEAQPCVARPFNVSAGKVVVTQGDTDRDLFIIEHGVAEVLVEGMDDTAEYLPE